VNAFHSAIYSSQLLPSSSATACLSYHVSSSLSSKQTVKLSPPGVKLPFPFFPQSLPSFACFLNLFALPCDSFIIISHFFPFVKYEFVKFSFHFLSILYNRKLLSTSFAKNRINNCRCCFSYALFIKMINIVYYLFNIIFVTYSPLVKYKYITLLPSLFTYIN